MALKMTFTVNRRMSMQMSGIPSLNIGINGAAASTPTQTRTVTPNDDIQVIDPDEGFLLSRVTVAPVPNYYGHIAFNGSVITVY